MADDPSPLAIADNAGHRARLRQRLLGAGGDALLDHEVIEYLLMLAIPRRDVKPLAKALLREFGGIGGVLSASPGALARVDGVGDSTAAALRIAQAAALRLLQSTVATRPVLASWQALLDYLRADMAHRATERVRVLFLNTRNLLIADEIVSEGSIDQAAVYVREVIRRALELSAASLIIVHNHPYDPASITHAHV